MSLTSPASAGVCCERYHVTTPDGTIPSTTMTSYTLNIATPQHRQDAFISVRCLDRLGTMGPEAFYRPNITTSKLNIYIVISFRLICVYFTLAADPPPRK